MWLCGKCDLAMDWTVPRPQLLAPLLRQMGKARIRVKKQRYGSCADFSGGHYVLEIRGEHLLDQCTCIVAEYDTFRRTANKVRGRGYIIENRFWRRGRDFSSKKDLRATRPLPRPLI